MVKGPVGAHLLSCLGKPAIRVREFRVGGKVGGGGAALGRNSSATTRLDPVRADKASLRGA